MFTDQDLNELVAFHAGQSSVLSVYLNVDPRQQTTEQYKLELRSLLKGAAQEAAPADVAAVEKYFDFEYAWQGRGVAVFSCQEPRFWRSYSLAVPVDNHAYVAHRPNIKPLTDVLDAYGRYGVVLVDREGARMFLFHLGELAEAAGTLGEEVRRAKHGGASGVAGMRGGMAVRAGRRSEATVQRNLREVADATQAFCAGHGLTRVVLGGAEPTTGQLLALLPKSLQDKVIGSFVIDLTAPVTEVQARSMDVIERVAQQREQELVESMIAGWKRGSGAVAGLSDTLAAIQEHRVSGLLISAGYEVSGYRCQNCRYLMVTEREECPLCGGPVEYVEDLVDSMTHRALEQDVAVEIVRGNEALRTAGSVGALLRY